MEKIPIANPLFAASAVLDNSEGKRASIELNAIKPEFKFLIKIGVLQIYIKLIYKQDIGLDNF